jgi:hypothetical protein
MDCFLIKDCIWDEDSQRDAVFQYVSGAIEKHGYTVLLDFSGMRQELKEFKTEIDEETKFVKDTRVKVLADARKDYYEVAGLSTNQNLIAQSDFKSLTNSNVSKYLYYWNGNNNRVEQYGKSYYSSSSFNLRKGNSEFSVFVNDTEYKLKTTIQGDKRQTTKKPHPSVEKDWDGRVDGFLQHTNEWKAQIETYRTKDLKHLRTNAFVKPAMANSVESHITATIKEIEKIEVDIRAIQNGYKKLKDEEVIINDSE